MPFPISTVLTQKLPPVSSLPTTPSSSGFGSWLLAALIGLVAIGGVRADPVDDYVAAQMSRQHIPGLSLAVLKDGKAVKVQGYGLANLELGTRATPETVYQIGSVTASSSSPPASCA